MFGEITISKMQIVETSSLSSSAKPEEELKASKREALVALRPEEYKLASKEAAYLRVNLRNSTS